jgi:hypothetical protein
LFARVIGLGIIQINYSESYLFSFSFLDISETPWQQWAAQYSQNRYISYNAAATCLHSASTCSWLTAHPTLF